MMYPIQYGFEVVSTPDGFHLVDRSEFNNWGEIRKDRPFKTLEEAYLHAFHCDEFKRGRRSRV